MLFFEHKHLYRRIKAEVPEERYTIPIGKARTHREGRDISVITWGAMVYTADEAAQQLENGRRLGRDDRPAHGHAVGQGGGARVGAQDVEGARAARGQRTGGFGGEIAATIAEEAFEDLDAPVKRVAAPDTPVPFSPPLEKAFIPQVEDVVKGLRDARGVLGQS